jgi:hypothetical protein
MPKPARMRQLSTAPIIKTSVAKAQENKGHVLNNDEMNKRKRFMTSSVAVEKSIIPASVQTMPQKVKQAPEEILKFTGEVINGGTEKPVGVKANMKVSMLPKGTESKDLDTTFDYGDDNVTESVDFIKQQEEPSIRMILENFQRVISTTEETASLCQSSAISRISATEDISLNTLSPEPTEEIMSESSIIDLRRKVKVKKATFVEYESEVEASDDDEEAGDRSRVDM